MVWYPCGELLLLNGIDPEAVVPMATRDEVLVVRGENKKTGREHKVLEKGPPDVLPL